MNEVTTEIPAINFECCACNNRFKTTEYRDGGIFGAIAECTECGEEIFRK